jgi:uncharacterized protein YbgA (DUF1722 family)/uncharacterized protein YbbK (DUF523 family)
VRFDGGHKEDRFLTHTLSKYFEWVPVCPEVELGLGTPRETMRLVHIEGATRLITQERHVDLTEALHAFAKSRVEALAAENLAGYILKSDSPSCGMERVRVYATSGIPARSGRGLFAEALMARFPNLPVEEEGRLCDPRIRENWIERVFAYRRLQLLWHSRWTIRSLIEFHTAHKLVLLAHAPQAYQNMGKLMARAKEVPRQELCETYGTEFMRALRVIATRGRHANVLQHMAGYFKEQLDHESRNELHGCIEDYQQGIVPLIVPLTLIKHYVRNLSVSYLAGQVYLNPHPRELALRNHV